MGNWRWHVFRELVGMRWKLRRHAFGRFVLWALAFRNHLENMGLEYPRKYARNVAVLSDEKEGHGAQNKGF